MLTIAAGVLLGMGAAIGHAFAGIRSTRSRLVQVLAVSLVVVVFDSSLRAGTGVPASMLLRDAFGYVVPVVCAALVAFIASRWTKRLSLVVLAGVAGVLLSVLLILLWQFVVSPYEVCNPSGGCL